MISTYIRSVLIWSIMLQIIAIVFESKLEKIATRSAKTTEEKANIVEIVKNPISMLKFSLLVGAIPIYRLIVALTIAFYEGVDD